MRIDGRLCVSFLAGMLPAVAPGLARAQAEPPERITYYETATVEARSLASATASVTVLDREEIEALNVSSVAELMRFIPGIDLTSNGPRGGVATAQIRGGDPNFTAVLVDGIPLNDPTDTFGGSVNLNSLATANVERIEIVRGPLSSFFGSTGLGGAINIITRRGRSEEPKGTFSAAAGDASVVQSALSLSQGGPTRDYFVGASWEQEEDRIVEDSFDRLTVEGSLGLHPSERSSLRFVGRINAWEGEDYPDASGGPVYGTGETRTSEHDEASLGFEWQLGRPERRHRLLASVYRHELDRASPAVPPVVPASIEHTVYTDTRLGWTYPAVQGDKTRLNVGVEVERQQGDNDSTLFLPGPFDGSYSIDRTTAGAFVELLSEHGPLLFELGVRIDAPEDFDEEWSPRAGLTYRFADATRVHVSAGRAFKLPSFIALASPAPLGGNPDLEPEIVLSADAGVEHAFFDGRLALSFVLFYNEFEDLIDFSFDPFGYVNQSEVESRGAELSADWRPSETIALHLNVTRQEVDNVGSSDELRHRPEWVGGLRFSQRIGARFRWELDGQSVSSSFDQQIPSDRRTTAGYACFGAAVAYGLGSSWEVNGRADNLTDREYETLIGFPGPGRSYRIGLAYRVR